MTKNLFSKIAIGTVQFGLDYGISNDGGQTPKAEVSKILQMAHQNGIDLLDTAFLYGESEAVLGRQELRSQFKIVSKFPEVETDAELKAFFNKSLNRLGLSSLYAYIAHRPNLLLNKPMVWKGLMSLKNQGLVKKVGFSVYEPADIIALQNAGFSPDLVQVPFSFLDQRFTEILEELHQKGTEVHTRSTFLQGLFFTKSEDLDAFFNPIKGWMKKLEASFPTNAERAAALLDYCLSRPFIDKVVMGINSSGQLEDNLKTLQTFNPEVIPSIEAIDKIDSITNPSLWPTKKN